MAHYSAKILEEELKNKVREDLFGAFDAEKIAFLEYWRVGDVFTQTDFNWNVTPSDHTTREFRHVRDLIAGTLDQGLRIVDYDADFFLAALRSSMKALVAQIVPKVYEHGFLRG